MHHYPIKSPPFPEQVLQVMCFDSAWVFCPFLWTWRLVLGMPDSVSASATFGICGTRPGRTSLIREGSASVGRLCTPQVLNHRKKEAWPWTQLFPSGLIVSSELLALRRCWYLKHLFCSLLRKRFKHFLVTSTSFFNWRNYLSVLKGFTWAHLIFLCRNK